MNKIYMLAIFTKEKLLLCRKYFNELFSIERQKIEPHMNDSLEFHLK